MKTFFLVIRSSMLLSIVWGASIFSLGNIMSWIVGLSDPLSAFELIMNPVAGGFIGYVGYVFYQKKKKLEQQQAANK